MNRRIQTYDRGAVVMNDDEYLLELQRAMRDLMVITTCDRGVLRMAIEDHTLRLQRAVFELIEIAKDKGLNNNVRVNECKELIRCIVLRCGYAGACSAGVPTCPLAIAVSR